MGISWEWIKPLNQTEEFGDDVSNPNHFKFGRVLHYIPLNLACHFGQL